MPVDQISHDPWAQWLLHGRHGDDNEYLRVVREMIEPFRDRLLRNARIEEGNTVLDIGSGDGLVALAALKRVGPQGRVLFSDISTELLDYCARLVKENGDSERCRFIRASADDLGVVADESVDVVTERAVLCYVRDKARALKEFFRVLRRGGRLSIFELVARFGHPAPPHLFWGYDVTPVLDLATKVRAVYGRIQPVEVDPFGDYDERQLFALVEQTGFGEIHLQYEAEVAPTPPRSWESLLKAAPNPVVPTLGEAIETALEREEAARFAEHLRPLVEQVRGIHRFAHAYIWAVKS